MKPLLASRSDKKQQTPVLSLMNVMNDQKMAKEYATATPVAWPQIVITLILSACLLTHLQKPGKATHVGPSRTWVPNWHAL